MKNPKREYKVISVPMPQMNMPMIAGIVGFGILLLGMMGYIIGDIRTPPPAPVSEPVVIVVTATPMPAVPTFVPTFPPTTQPTIQPIEPSPAPTEAAVQETWGVQIVIDTPVPSQPVQLVSAQDIQPVQVDPWLAYTQTAVPEGGPMTGAQCAAAGAAAGWSATWGPASDGCWIIAPDGSQIRHLGTWAGE